MTEAHGFQCGCGETFHSADRLKTHTLLEDVEIRDQHEVRKPSDEEIEALIQYYRRHTSLNEQGIRDFIESAYHAVIEDYTTDCPGYAGPILIEIGAAGPSFYTAYRWDEDGWKRLTRTEETRRFDNKVTQ